MLRSRKFVCIAALAFCACPAIAVGGPSEESKLRASSWNLLEIYNPSLTTYLAGDTVVQLLGPIFEQRGVDLDGTLRSPQPLGWAIAADPFGGGYGSGRRVGDINLATGTYSPTEIDFALPARGPGVVIGRTYNCRQAKSGSHSDSDGHQGFNWAQAAQPEIIYKAVAGHPEQDTIYLVYGADRYIEFASLDSSALVFKAKNGAAGIIDKTVGTSGDPDLFTYYDQRGTAITFFGFNSGANPAKGQWWKTTDAAANTAYVDNDSNPVTAISSGYDGSGRALQMFDASNRRYTFTYSTVGGSKTRLTRVKAEIQSGGSWTSPTTVGQVDYEYYTGSSDTSSGLAGDLRVVTVTMPVAGSSDYVRNKYYRYYISTWSNSDGSRGNDHQIKLAVGFEGVRNVGTGSLAGTSDDDLKPYSEAWMEYVSSSDYRIAKGIFNGECGCSGGSNGTYEFTYDNCLSYATYIASGSYDQAWATRTVVTQPDSNYVTAYFDEVGQVQARVMTNAIPTGSPSKMWVTEIERDAMGCVTNIFAPETNSSYVHDSTGNPDGSLGHSNGGLVTEYERSAASNELDGLRIAVKVKNGSGGSPTTVSSVTLDHRQFKSAQGGEVTYPFIDSSSVYPAGSAITTNMMPTWWSCTNTDQQY
ncbi:MAG: hypothetical protein ACREJO_15820, partial [Phycisphaerales bacterium]